MIIITSVISFLRVDADGNPVPVLSGGAFENTFEAGGEYPNYRVLHQNMTGLVPVRADGSGNDIEGVLEGYDQTLVRIADVYLLADIADTAEKRSAGLGVRDSMEEGHAMLFTFEVEGRHSFWMSGMKFPLDIIWMDSNMVVVHIEHSLEPCSNQFLCPTYQPDENSMYVLETTAGFSERYGVMEGTRVDFRLGEDSFEELIAKEDLGIRGINMTPGIAREMNFDEARGVLITSIVGDSPAERAGLRGGSEIVEIDGNRIAIGGDVIIAIDGRLVDDVEDARAILEQKMIRDNVRFSVLRNGIALDVNITISYIVEFRQKLAVGMGDSEVTVTVHIVNPYKIEQPYSAVFEVRDTEGYTVFLTWNTGILQPNDERGTYAVWKPDTSGRYMVRAFVVTDVENPLPLTPVTETGFFFQRSGEGEWVNVRQRS